MAGKIARTAIINRRTSRNRAIDPAQNGEYYARIYEQRLTITAIRNQIVFRSQGVMAALWENDETILLVLREEVEDEPIVERAFQPRTRREFDTEDAHATAHLSPDGAFVALEFEVPNAAIAILPTGKMSPDYTARQNLGFAADSIVWSDDSKTVRVTSGQQVLVWSPGQRQFKKTRAAAD